MNNSINFNQKLKTLLLATSALGVIAFSNAFAGDDIDDAGDSDSEYIAPERGASNRSEKEGTQSEKSSTSTSSTVPPATSIFSGPTMNAPVNTSESSAPGTSTTTTGASTATTTNTTTTSTSNVTPPATSTPNVTPSPSVSTTSSTWAGFSTQGPSLERAEQAQGQGRPEEVRFEEEKEPEAEERDPKPTPKDKNLNERKKVSFDPDSFESGPFKAFTSLVDKSMDEFKKEKTEFDNFVKAQENTEWEIIKTADFLKNSLRYKLDELKIAQEKNAPEADIKSIQDEIKKFNADIEGAKLTFSLVTEENNKVFQQNLAKLQNRLSEIHATEAATMHSFNEKLLEEFTKTRDDTKLMEYLYCASMSECISEMMTAAQPINSEISMLSTLERQKEGEHRLAVTDRDSDEIRNNLVSEIIGTKQVISERQKELDTVSEKYKAKMSALSEMFEIAKNVVSESNHENIAHNIELIRTTSLNQVEEKYKEKFEDLQSRIDDANKSKEDFLAQLEAAKAKKDADKGDIEFAQERIENVTKELAELHAKVEKTKLKQEEKVKTVDNTVLLAVHKIADTLAKDPKDVIPSYEEITKQYEAKVSANEENIDALPAEIKAAVLKKITPLDSADTAKATASPDAAKLEAAVLSKGGALTPADHAKLVADYKAALAKALTAEDVKKALERVSSLAPNSNYNKILIESIAKAKSSVDSIPASLAKLEAANPALIAKNYDGEIKFGANDANVKGLTNSQKANLFMSSVAAVAPTKREQAIKDVKKEANNYVNIGSIIGEVASNSISNRLAAVNNTSITAAAGDSVPANNSPHGVWASGSYSHSKIKSSNGINGFKGHASGFSLGYDNKIDENNLVGIAYSFVDSHFKPKTKLKVSNVTAKSHIISLYGQHDLNDSLVLNETLSFARSHIHTKTSKFLGKDVLAKGKIRNKSFSAQGILGYKLDTATSVNLTPSFGLKYVLSKDGAYTEKGAGVHNLSYKSKKYQSLSTIFGITAEAPVVKGDLKLTPALSASYERDLIAKNPKVRARQAFMDKDFDNLAKHKTAKNHFNVGAGLSVEKNNVLVAANYNLKLDKKATSHQAALKLRVGF